MKIEVQKDWWKALFDHIYLITDARSVCDEELTSKEVDLIESALNIDKKAAILDLCGGQGRHAMEFSGRGYSRMTVLDYAPYLVAMGHKAACKKNLGTAFIRGDARRTGISNNSFNAVMILGSSFGYFVEEDENLKVLRESFRLLKKGGVLLLDLPEKAFVLRGFKPKLCHLAGKRKELKITRHRKLEGDVIYSREIVTNEEGKRLRDNKYCIRLYSREQISTLLDQAGFAAPLFNMDFISRSKKGDFGSMTHRMMVKAVRTR